MVHEGQGLALGLEAGNHLGGVHAELDHLEGDPAPDGLGLFGHVHDAGAALADLFEQLVSAYTVAGLLDDRGLAGPSRQRERAPEGADGTSAVSNVLGQRSSAFSA